MAVNQAQGNTVRPMVLNLSGILLNLVLDYFLRKFQMLGDSPVLDFFGIESPVFDETMCIFAEN